MGRVPRHRVAVGGLVELQSKSGKSLARYFPEIFAALLDTACEDYVLEGELLLPIDGALSFDALQARLHPAESRIRRLSGETPAQLMLFNCLALDGRPPIDRPLDERRSALSCSTRGTARRRSCSRPTRPTLQARRRGSPRAGALSTA